MTGTTLEYPEYSLDITSFAQQCPPDDEEDDDSDDAADDVFGVITVINLTDKKVSP